MNIRQLRALLEVARQGSFTAAANRLFMAQPTLSELVAQVETALGLRLLERTTRRVTTTREGEMVVQIAERLVASFDEAVRDINAIAGGRQGRISLAALPSAATRFIPPMIARFNEEHPNIGIALRDANAFGVQRSVEQGEVEIGITSLWAASPAIDHETLVTDEFGLVCSVNHRLGKSFDPVRWSEVVGEDLVGLGPQTGIHQILAPLATDLSWLKRPKYEIENITTVLSLLERGVGIAILPALSLPPVIADSLVFRGLLDPAISRDIKIIWRRDRPPSPLALRMIEILKTVV